jgi:hypothetical protein
MLAVKDLRVCPAHGGYRSWAWKGVLVKSGKGELFAVMRRAVKADRSRAAPPELTALSVYQEASQRMRQRLILAFGTEAWGPTLVHLRAIRNKQINVYV